MCFFRVRQAGLSANQLHFQRGYWDEAVTKNCALADWCIIIYWCVFRLSFVGFMTTSYHWHPHLFLMSLVSVEEKHPLLLHHQHLRQVINFLAILIVALLVV